MITRQTIGARLRAAREDRGWTQEEASRRLNIPRSRLALIEAGQRPVDGVLLYEFAQAYGHGPLDFLFEEPAANPLGVLSRAEGFSDEAKVELKKLYALARDQASLQRRLGVKTQARVSYQPAAGQTPLEQGEDLAAQERRRLGLGDGPVADVFSLLEDQDVTAFALECSGEADGGFFWSEEAGRCVFVAPPGEAFAWRFVTLHQYCHTLVDRSLGASVCRASPRQRQRPLEARADAFAAAFLMPRPAFYRVAGELGRRPSQLLVTDVLRIMWHFGASLQAVSCRLKSLGLAGGVLEVISKTGAAVTHMAQMGFDPAEAGRPFQVWAQGGCKRRLHMLAVEAYRRNLIPLGKAAEFLDLPPDEAAEVIEGLGVEIHRSQPELDTPP